MSTPLTEILGYLPLWFRIVFGFWVVVTAISVASFLFAYSEAVRDANSTIHNGEDIHAPSNEIHIDKDPYWEEPTVASKDFLRIKYGLDPLPASELASVMSNIPPGTYVFAKATDINPECEFTVYAEDHGFEYIELHKRVDGKNFLIGYTTYGAAKRLDDKDINLQILVHKIPDIHSKCLALVEIPTTRINNIIRENLGEGFLINLLPF
jgi:hypothetical protein